MSNMYPPQKPPPHGAGPRRGASASYRANQYPEPAPYPEPYPYSDPYQQGGTPPGYPPGVYLPPRPRRSNFGLNPLFFRLVIVALLAAMLALPVLVAVGAYAYFQVTERIVPGVFVGESRLSGMTTEQAAAELHRVWNMEHTIHLTDGIHTLAVPPAQLGLSLDPWQTAQAAMNVAHGQDPISEVNQMVRSLVQGWGIGPVVLLDPAMAQAGLEAISGQVSLPPKDASFHLEGETLVAVPAELGYTVNVEETLAALTANPQGVMLAGYLQIVLKPVSPRVTDVSAAMAQAQSLLDSPVSIRAYDAITNERMEWPLSRQVIASWLIVEPGEQGPVVALDEDQVAQYLNGLGDQLGANRFIDVEQYSASLSRAVSQGAPLSVILSHRPTSYIVQPGDTLIAVGWKVGIPYWMILQANPGLNPDALFAGQELVIPSKDQLLPLPIVENKRVVLSIGQQRMWVYQNDQLLSEHIISTGIDRSPTQPGVFQVQTHERNAYASVWDLHMPHFLGIYEAWPGFMNGIHGLPTLSNGRRLWANILGSPASYGCIILGLEDAEALYNWAENGVVVEITP